LQVMHPAVISARNDERSWECAIPQAWSPIE
jgi:hypothetical protein